MKGPVRRGGWVDQRDRKGSDTWLLLRYFDFWNHVHVSHIQKITWYQQDEKLNLNAIRSKWTEFKNTFFSFIFISWRLITLQYCSDFCHTLTWISHGFTCVPHPNPPSHLPPHPIPLGLPSAPALSTCLMYPTWAGDLFHTYNIHVSMLFSQIIPPLPSPTESKSLFFTSVSLLLPCL